MKKFLSEFLLVSSLAAFLLIISGHVFAAYDTDKEKLQLITYPVKELGGCQDFNACKIYCNKDENIPTCLRFDIKNLYSKEDAQDAKRLLSLMDESGLPGKCQDAVACFSYCESAAHTDECWDYAQRHNLTRGYDLETIQRMAKFAREGGKFPGNCQGQSQCEAYCGTPNHFAECADFGEKAGIMTKEETDMMRKIARSGLTKFPGNCTSKGSCDTYCKAEEHFDECIDFAEKAGFVSKEDVKFARKTHGKTPGDCARGVTSAEEGKKACSAYCAKSENQKVCMDFAVQVGLISEDDAKELSGGGSLEDFNACLPHIDPKMLQCFDVLGKDAFEKLKAGQVPDDFNDIKTMVGKMKEVRSCINKRVDESFSKLPADGFVCLEKEFGSNPIEKIKSGRISCRDFSGAEERIKACMMDKQLSQLDACLNVSCSEITQCVSKLAGGEQGDKSEQSDMDPAMKGKMGAIKAKMNSCVTEQIRTCLSKDCEEMMSCMNALQGQGGKQKQEKGQSNIDQGLEQEITAKMTGCMKPKGGDQGGQGNQNQGQNQSQQGGGAEGGGMNADVCANQGGSWNGSQCDFSKKGAPAQIPQEYCSSFASVPSCSYVGAPDSQNYQYCKQCFPNK
ncbi:MAG: hypothetical protein HY507_01315 [Candidatus Zambryskibacteria bacterium]|nr:hypothetical protein [Candidatus Zambryskibacteria bacterium]